MVVNNGCMVEKKVILSLLFPRKYVISQFYINLHGNVSVYINLQCHVT